jgi:hypothetical protein
MKTFFKSLLFLSGTFFAAAEEQSANTEAVPLKPLIQAMEMGGLARVNAYLDEGGKWPRITTDSFAIRNKITNQDALVDLSDRLVSLITERSEAELSSEIGVLESEAKLLFALSDKLWKSDGYRNRVASLLCGELANFRCGKIIILSRGEKMGPKRSEILKIYNSGDMLNLFVTMIPENADLSNSGLSEALVANPVKEETWLEIIAALRKIELAGSTVGEKFDESVKLGVKCLGTIISKENISSLVLHYGWSQLNHEQVLPALAMYLKNGGSLETLIKEPANATKFEDVMKNGTFQFSMTPVMSGIVGVSLVSLFVEDIQSPKEITRRLFGIQK